MIRFLKAADILVKLLRLVIRRVTVEEGILSVLSLYKLLKISVLNDDLLQPFAGFVHRPEVSANAVRLTAPACKRGGVGIPYKLIEIRRSSHWRHKMRSLQRLLDPVELFP